MITKDSKVEIDNLHPDILNRIEFLDIVLRKYTGKEAVITSGHEGYSGDGIHKINSKHYIYDKDNNKIRKYSQAIDVRSMNVKLKDINKCLADLKIAFPERHGFKVIFEGNHFHIQYG